MMLSSYVPGFGIWRLPAENIEKNYLGTTLLIIFGFHFYVFSNFLTDFISLNVTRICINSCIKKTNMSILFLLKMLFIDIVVASSMLTLAILFANCVYLVSAEFLVQRLAL